MGTNPISVAAPGKDGDSFVLDMATSSVALGKVSGRDKKAGKGDCDLVLLNLHELHVYMTTSLK